MAEPYNSDYDRHVSTTVIWAARLGIFTGLVSAALVAAQPSDRTARRASLAQVRVSYADAQQIIYELRDDLLPLALQGKGPKEQEASFVGWLSSHNETAVERVLRGDEDSIVNLLLFGVSFTSGVNSRMSRLRGARANMPASRSP